MVLQYDLLFLYLLLRNRDLFIRQNLVQPKVQVLGPHVGVSSARLTSFGSSPALLSANCNPYDIHYCTAQILSTSM